MGLGTAGNVLTLICGDVCVCLFVCLTKAVVSGFGNVVGKVLPRPCGGWALSLSLQRQSGGHTSMYTLRPDRTRPSQVGWRGRCWAEGGWGRSLHIIAGYSSDRISGDSPRLRGVG